MNTPPVAGARFRGMHQICALVFLVPALAFACDYPKEGPVALQRALTNIERLPETEAWQAEKRKAGEPVEFRLLLDKEVYLNRKCHWTVEALTKGELWRRFYVSPDGDSVLIDYETSRPAQEPPRPRRSPGAKAAKP